MVGARGRRFGIDPLQSKAAGDLRAQQGDQRDMAGAQGPAGRPQIFTHSDWACVKSRCFLCGGPSSETAAPGVPLLLHKD